MSVSEIKQTEELYQSLVENTPDVVTRWDKNLKLIFANAALERKLGIKKESVYGLSKLEIGLPEDIAVPWMQKFREAFETGSTVTYQSPLPTPGGIVFFHSRIVPEKNMYGEVETILSIARDITDLKEAELELKASRERFQASIDVAPMVLGMLKSIRNEQGQIHDFRFEWVSKGGITFLGMDLSGSLLTDRFFYSRHSDMFMHFVATAESGEPFDLSHLHETESQMTWLRWKAVKLDDGLFVSIEDITERKNAEYELIDLRLKQQREVLNAIILAQEEERQRIGEALHDGIAQLLYGIQTRLQLLHPNGKEDEKSIRDTLAILSDAINDTRRISFELVPAVLKDYGIEMALKALFQRIIKDKPLISLHCSNLKKRLPEQMEFAIYRIVQELVNNILKHSQATEANIEISIKKQEISLLISDNGIGFREHETERIHKGIGLQSVKNRVKLLEGKFRIQSSSASGTLIQINLPLSE